MEITTKEGTITYTINADGVLEQDLSAQDDSVTVTADLSSIDVESIQLITSSSNANDQQVEQEVVGHEVEVVSVDPGKMARPFLTTNKPSLLRRGPRTSSVSSYITAYPPQISPSVLSRFGQINHHSTNPSPTTSYLSSSSQPSVSSMIYYDRKPIINSAGRVSTSASNHGITTTAGNGRSSTDDSVEEIVIWQPGDEEDCEIVEVDEEQLQQLFQQQRQQGDYEDDDDQEELQLATNSIINNIPTSSGGFQQIIVCDGQNIQLSDLLQNYMLEVASNSQGGRGGGRKLKVPKLSKRKINTELKCQEEGCTGFVHNVIDLRKHLQNHHMMELDEEIINFANDDEFKMWRANYERDRKVSFIYRGGTKRISAEKAVTYLICHRSGIYKPTPGAASDRKRKMKPQGSCKIGTHCTAGVKLLKNLTNGTTEATICHTHYGHELENIQHLRVNATVKEIIVGKFDEGLTFTEVLQYVHHNPDGLEGLRVVDRRAIRNIYDQWKKNKEIPHQFSLIGHKVEPTDEQQTADESIPLEDIFVSTSAATTAETLEKEPTQQTDEEETQSSARLAVKDAQKARKSESKSKSHNASSKITNMDIKIEKTESLAPNLTPTTSTKKRQRKSSTQPVKSLNEAVHDAIEKLLDHGESGPTVLFYKRAGTKTPDCGENSEAAKLIEVEDLCVILQTPVQRQLLQMFGKILYVDVIVSSDLDLIILAVLDEFLTAIPVAWMISTEATSNLVELCFQLIKDNCVEVKCEYFFSRKQLDYHKLWSKVFIKKPRLFFTQEDTIKDFGTLARRHFEESDLRIPVAKLLETLVTTPDRAAFEETLKTVRHKSSSFAKLLGKDWLLNKSQWAFHTRLQIPYVIEDSFSRLKKFILFKGTKNMSRNLDSVFKIGYDRCFQRNKSLFKGDLKFQQLLDSIQANHDADYGEIIRLRQLSGNKFLVEDKFEVYDLHTECKCRIRCAACGVCAHRFWCSCKDNLNFCSHAHQVCVFSKPGWPVKQEKIDLPEPVALELQECVPDMPEDAVEFTDNIEKENDTTQQLEECDNGIFDDAEADNIEFETVLPEVHELINSVPLTQSSEVIIPDLLAPELDHSRRISSRIKTKVSRPMEDVFEAVAQKKTRRSNSTSNVPNSTPSAPTTSASTTETISPVIVEATRPSSSSSPVIKRRPGRPPTKRTAPSSSESQTSSQDDVKGEIKNLLEQIKNVSDEKVLAQIRKRVSDITGLLN